MVLMLYTHPSRAASLREADQVHVEPGVPVEEFVDPFGNRCGRLVAPPGKLRLWNMTLI
jgi:transglutaminase-like putative cysteine protease